MPIRVTIFDDNKNLLESLFQLVNGSRGFECVGAFPNCNELINDIKESRPDVVLMDIQMPGISGIEAVKILKANFPKVKVLMETIFEEDEKVFLAICYGAEGYILKNTPPIETLQAIREVYDGGSPMTPSIASKVLKMFRSNHMTQHESFSLSERENEVLGCLVKGMSYKLIADSCFISVDTVRSHIKKIYEKLQVHSKSEAVAKAIKGRIV